MPRVALQVFEDAINTYHKADNTSATHPRSFFGITKKQWVKFKQTKKLKVSQAAVLKLKHASLLNNPHHKALFKVLEARSE